MTAILSALSSLPASLPGAGGGVVFDGYGGAINQVAASDTAFVHRNAVSCAQYSVTYANTSPSQSDDLRPPHGCRVCTKLSSP